MVAENNLVPLLVRGNLRQGDEPAPVDRFSSADSAVADACERDHDLPVPVGA